MHIGRTRKSSTANDISESTGDSPKTARMVKTRETANVSSEEDVFARLVSDEIARTKDSDSQASFKALIDKQIAIRTRADGTVNWEKVAKGALKWASSEKQNVLSRDEAEQIYSRSFCAAQLDSNTDSLDDNSVSGATMNTDLAFEKARVKLEKLISNQAQTPARSLSEKVTSLSTQSTTSTDSGANDLSDIVLSNINFQI